MLKQYNSGFTLVEILIVMGILFVILGVVVVVNINPAKRTASARDLKRIDNLSQLAIAIESYRLDNGFYPDTENTLRTSTVSTGTGWISAELGKYLPTQPIDPINNQTYFYSYQNAGSSYELNTQLEEQKDKQQSDKGNNPNKYEVGSNLEILD